MNLEQWQRSEKIKAEAEAAAKRTVERVLNAVKEPAMSEFDDWAYENGLSRTKDEDGYFSKNTEFSSKAWQHQQARLDELQHRNQMLNDNIKEQGQKLVYQNEVIEKQAEKLLGLRDEKAELQKQVDAALKKLDKRRDELWSKWKWQADMQDQGAANAFEEAYWILEQAIKGEG